MSSSNVYVPWLQLKAQVFKSDHFLSVCLFVCPSVYKRFRFLSFTSQEPLDQVQLNLANISLGEVDSNLLKGYALMQVEMIKGINEGKSFKNLITVSQKWKRRQGLDVYIYTKVGNFWYHNAVLIDVMAIVARVSELAPGALVLNYPRFWSFSIAF